ncbi:MAG TPA: hypothetical protein PLV62_01865 [Spirochaetota bacterium]|nr:hypothetical protein [Spirochaetota bacterium]HPK43703.1 hypothetical protein [Spirochaetota bacterium]
MKSCQGGRGSPVCTRRGRDICDAMKAHRRLRWLHRVSKGILSA